LGNDNREAAFSYIDLSAKTCHPPSGILTSQPYSILPLKLAIISDVCYFCRSDVMKTTINSAFLKKYHPALLRWYDENQRRLPWRDTDDAYSIWISEVMLQQTQVRTAIPYYNRFMHKFPTVHALANAHQQTILLMWEGLGYYSRARNLHRAANIIVQDYKGILPQTWKQIRNLPGIGDYIAAAILSIAFSRPHAVLDGNVKRVIARLFCVDIPVNRPSAKKKFSAVAAEMLYHKDPGKYNQAVMELGALVCTPKSPDCARCPVKNLCDAYSSSSVMDYPKKIKPKSTPSHHLVAGVVMNKNKILITQRPEPGLLGGLWEFPGGQIQNKENNQKACLRTIEGSTGLQIEILDYLTSIKHAYTHFKIKVDVFLCRANSSAVRLNGPNDHRWINIDDIDTYPLHKAVHKFLPRVHEAMEGFRF